MHYRKPITYVQLQSTSTSKAMASGTLARMRLILTKPPSLQIAQTQEFFNFSQPDRNSLKFGFREQITNWYDHIIPASTFQHQCAQMHTMSVHELDSVSFISKFMWTQRPGALLLRSWSWTYQIHRTFNWIKRLSQCSWQGASAILPYDQLK
jgi:hypothetical protein